MNNSDLQEYTLDPASYKDPSGSVRIYQDRIERTCRDSEVEHVRAFLASSLYQTLHQEGLLLEASWNNTNKTVQQPRIPFWNYPYEWSFEMLKDAALLTLEIQQRCLASGHSLKDAAAFNVVFHHGHPVFIDVYSFDRYAPRLSWDAYGQFCNEFLNPLIWQKETSQSFHGPYRGYLNGIPTPHLVAILPWYTCFKRGYFTHIFLKNWLEKQYGSPSNNKKTTSATKQSIELSAELTSSIQQKLLGKLEKILNGLKSRHHHSLWTGYATTRNYQAEELQKKKDFVLEFFSTHSCRSILDYGCNTGEFSELVSPHTKTVIAVDSDERCIDNLYLRQKAGSCPKNILPLVQDLATPSSPSGWESRERRGFSERIQTEGFLALALIHHLRFSNNVPTDHILRFFSSRHEQGVLEYVGLEDSMVRHLLRNRPSFDVSDYQQEAFESLLKKYFHVEKSQAISPNRKIFSLRRVGDGSLD